jgi:hypothetical protein
MVILHAKWLSYIKVMVLVHFALLTATHIQAQAPAQPNASFTIENYYKVKWGYAEEFIRLWKKNHYPLLKKAKEKGDIIRIVAEKPLLHSSEESRWDFKVTLVFKNSALAFDPNLTVPYRKELYPNEPSSLKTSSTVLNCCWHIGMS